MFLSLVLLRSLCVFNSPKIYCGLFVKLNLLTFVDGFAKSVCLNFHGKKLRVFLALLGQDLFLRLTKCEINQLKIDFSRKKKSTLFIFLHINHNLHRFFIEPDCFPNSSTHNKNETRWFYLPKIYSLYDKKALFCSYL